MDYIYDFSIISAVYLTVTAFFYSRQPKVPSRRNSIFAGMLYLGIVFCVLDVFTVIVEPYANNLPSWIVYVEQIVFLGAIQLSSVLFAFYCIALTGLTKNLKKSIEFILFIPFICILVLLVLSVFGNNGVFYLDSNNVYHRGVTYVALYINTAIYTIIGALSVFVFRRRLQRDKLICIAVFIIAVFIAMVIQFFKKDLLLNAMANAFALTIIYHILEAPSTHVDYLTGTLNRAALPLVLQEVYEQERRFTIFMFTVNSLQNVNHSSGMKAGDNFLKYIAGYLKSNYPKSYIFRTTGNVFILLRAGGVYINASDIEAIKKSIPETVNINGIALPLKISLFAINSEDISGSDSMLDFCEYIIRRSRSTGFEQMCLADNLLLDEFQRSKKMSSNLKNAIENERIEVFYQPIHDSFGRLTALEALVRIRDSEGGYMPTQDAVELAEQNGSIHKLGEIILRKVCAFIRDNNAASWGLHHIGVNLSSLQIASKSFPETVVKIINEYNIDSGIIGFEVTETAASSVSDIYENMQHMKSLGFAFLLDDFGKGYANFSHIEQLPLLCVKIDKAILWEAGENAERKAFLSGIINMLNDMGLISVCEGIENIAQSEMLCEMGINMMQGYYFSKPLSQNDILTYIAEELSR